MVSKNQLIMDAEYRIPEELAPEMGGEPFTMPAGKYPLMFEGQKKWPSSRLGLKSLALYAVGRRYIEF